MLWMSGLRPGIKLYTSCRTSIGACNFFELWLYKVAKSVMCSFTLRLFTFRIRAYFVYMSKRSSIAQANRRETCDGYVAREAG